MLYFSENELDELFLWQMWQLWQQKIKVLFICVCTRARRMCVCVRRCLCQQKFFNQFVVSMWRKTERIHLVCEIYVAKYGLLKGKSAVFSVFFTLCPHFNAYIFRGGCVRKGAKRGRTEKGSSMRPIEKWVYGLFMPPFRVSSSERKWRGRRANKDQREHPKQPREELCTTRAQE